MEVFYYVFWTSKNASQIFWRSFLGSTFIVKHKLNESIPNWIQIYCNKKPENERSQILLSYFCHIAWNSQKTFLTNNIRLEPLKWLLLGKIWKFLRLLYNYVCDTIYTDDTFSFFFFFFQNTLKLYSFL